MKWDRPLTRSLSLKRRGKKVELVTLLDAAKWISDNFGNTIQDIPIEEAIKDLMQAAETGEVGDIERITNQIEIVAQRHNWLRPG